MRIEKIVFFSGHHLWVNAIGLIVVGGVTVLITFLCFFGKIRSNPCLLLYVCSLYLMAYKTFFIHQCIIFFFQFLSVLGVIYFFEIISGIAVIIDKSNLDSTLASNLNQTFNRYGSNHLIWNHIQLEVNILLWNWQYLFYLH